VVGFSPAAGQSQRLRSASGVDKYQLCRDCASSTVCCRCYTGGRHVSLWLLPATAAPTACQIYVSRGRKDAGPGVHFVSPGLLQLTVLRHRRRSHDMSRLQTTQNAAAHLVSGARRYDVSRQASSSTSGGFQDGTLVRHGSNQSSRQLLVGLRGRLSSAAFCHINDVRRETNTLQQLWRQVFCSCRSEAAEQPSNCCATS